MYYVYKKGIYNNKSRLPEEESENSDSRGGGDNNSKECMFLRYGT